MGIREAYHEVRHTLIGKMWIALGVVAFPSLLALVVEDHFKHLAAHPGQLDGLLVAAHLALVINFLLLLPPLFAKVFVLKGTDEPLVAHPFATPALALHRLLVSTVLVGAIYLLTFHYIFFGRAVLSRLDHPWIGLPIHLLTSLACLLGIGVAMGAACRSLLGRRGVVQRAHLVFRFGGALFVAAFAGSLATLNFVVKNAPEWFAMLGEVAGRSFYFLIVPLGAAFSTNRGNWVGLLVWLPAAGIAAYVALRAARVWSRVAHVELPLDLEAPVKRHYRSVFTRSRHNGKSWHAFGPFWRKDVLAPYGRDLRSYLSQQWFAISSEIGAVVLVAVLKQRGLLDAAHCSALLVAVLLTSVAAFAMLRGLNSLGAEGSALALLRPVVAGRELFVAKGLVNGLYVLVHALFHALVLIASAHIAGLWNIGFLFPLALAVSSAVVLTLGAGALGFLLPDLRRRAVFLPGASSIAKYLYVGVSGLLVTFVAASHLQFTLQRIDLATYAGLVSSIAATLVAAFSALAWCAINRLDRIEL